MSETFAIQDRTEWRKKHRLFWGLATIRCSPNDRSATQGMCRRRSTRLWQQLRKQSNNQQNAISHQNNSFYKRSAINWLLWLIHSFISDSKFAHRQQNYLWLLNEFHLSKSVWLGLWKVAKFLYFYGFTTQKPMLFTKVILLFPLQLSFTVSLIKITINCAGFWWCEGRP